MTADTAPTPPLASITLERTGKVESERLASGREDAIEDRRSLGHKDRALAADQAKELAKELAEATLSGHTPGRLTLGELFAHYRHQRLHELAKRRQKEPATRMAMFTQCWGRDLPVSEIRQAHVNRYVRERRALDVLPPTLMEREDGSRARGYRTPRVPRDEALDGELGTLSTILNWATRHRVKGKRLLMENPLHGLTRPKEKNPRRPVASHDRYEKTQEHTNSVDPAGRLRMILSLVRWTGRRAAAICQLRASDILLTQDRVGDVPLFPAPARPEAPISYERVSKWLRTADKRAELPKLAGGLWHPYRRLWASERMHLPDRIVADAGGWRDTRALKMSYQHATAREIQPAIDLE